MWEIPGIKPVTTGLWKCKLYHSAICCLWTCLLTCLSVSMYVCMSVSMYGPVCLSVGPVSEGRVARTVSTVSHDKVKDSRKQVLGLTKKSCHFIMYFPFKWYVLIIAFLNSLKTDKLIEASIIINLKIWLKLKGAFTNDVIILGGGSLVTMTQDDGGGGVGLKMISGEKFQTKWFKSSFIIRKLGKKGN